MYYVDSNQIPVYGHHGPACLPMPTSLNVSPTSPSSPILLSPQALQVAQRFPAPGFSNAHLAHPPTPDMLGSFLSYKNQPKHLFLREIFPNPFIRILWALKLIHFKEIFYWKNNVFNLRFANFTGTCEHGTPQKLGRGWDKWRMLKFSLNDSCQQVLSTSTCTLSLWLPPIYAS